MLELIENKKIIDLEHAVLSSYLENMFGYCLLQLGDVDTDFTQASPVQRKICLDPEYSKDVDTALVQGEFEHLPFLPDSIDVVVARHILEFTPKPYRVLQEIYRVLIPNGYLLLVGFNPFSLLGFKNILTAQNIKMVSAYKLRQLSDRLGLHEVEHKFLKYNFIRDIYIFVLQKKVIPLTLIGKQVDQERVQAISPVAKPTTRVRHEEN